MSADFIVQFSAGEKTRRGHATALGGGGLFLTLEDPLSLGAEVMVQFRPAKHLPKMNAKAKVCYVVIGQGMALEFTEISDEDRRLLLQLIHSKTSSKRKHPRAPLAAQIEYQQAMSLAFARDISVGGMFIETTHPLPVGTRLNMRFNIDDQSTVVVASAEVTYQVGKMGVGIKFVDVSPEDLKRIEDYVDKSQTTTEMATAR